MADSNYEAAPATRMLATHCLVCNRPLVEAVSVQTGIGPECRKKSGYDATVDSAVRDEANRLVYQIAADRHMAPEQLDAACKRLEHLGFGRLAARVLDARVRIHIDIAGGFVELRSPFSEALLPVPGRRWIADREINRYPESAKVALYAALKLAFPGQLARGPKGLFKIAA